MVQQILRTSIALLLGLLFQQNPGVPMYALATPPSPVYQNDVLGVQVADTTGLRIVEDGMIANDSSWGFSLVKTENGGNGALVLSVALVDQAPPDVTQAAAKVVAAYPDLSIQQTDITVDGKPGKLLFPLPGPNGATYIFLATNQQLYRIIYAADKLDATGEMLLRQLHFIKPTRTLAALGLKRAADEPIQATSPADQALPKGQEIDPASAAHGVIDQTDALRNGECILSAVGMITGAANFEDKSIDGAFATFIYDGGATQAIRIVKGKFAAPLLARRCDSGLDTIGFQLTIGEWREYIKLQGTDLDLVIQLQSAPEKVENVAEHEVVLGTISGLVRKDGQPVPDDTEVNVYIAGGLQQTVFTRNSIYRATTIGDLSDGIETYLPVTIKIDSEEVNIVPSLCDMVQDIDFPNTPPVAITVPVSEWPVYRHVQLGIELRYPPTWKPYDVTSAFVRFADPNHAAQSEDAFNVVNGGFRIDSVTDFVEHIGMPIVMTETMQIDGQPALYMQLAEQVPEEYRSVVGILMPDQRTVTIGNRTMDSTIFKQVLATIRFFPPTNPP